MISSRQLDVLGTEATALRVLRSGPRTTGDQGTRERDRGPLDGSTGNDTLGAGLVLRRTPHPGPSPSTSPSPTVTYLVRRPDAAERVMRAQSEGRKADHGPLARQSCRFAERSGTLLRAHGDSASRAPSTPNVRLRDRASRVAHVAPHRPLLRARGSGSTTRCTTHVDPALWRFRRAPQRVPSGLVPRVTVMLRSVLLPRRPSTRPPEPAHSARHDQQVRPECIDERRPDRRIETPAHAPYGQVGLHVATRVRRVRRRRRDSRRR